MDGQGTVTATGPDTSVSVRQTYAARASRSDDRQSLADAEAAAQAATIDDPTADPNAVIDTTPTVSSTERKSLQALTSAGTDLTTLVGLAQDQKNQQAQVLISEQEAAKQAAAKAEADAAETLAQAEATRLLGVIVAPIEGSYRLTARFGQRGGLWSGGWHTGLDFSVPSGTKVVAAAGGTIISAGWGGAYGNRIEIDNGNGYVTAYNHLSKIEKTSGTVFPGEEIGRSGSTGNTTGPHLHFEVTKDGTLINPSTWLWGTNK
jgi:murein DD-endopeptidase MepM/ murein hydrolase activator NlpD